MKYRRPTARDIAYGVGAHLAKKYVPYATDYAIRKAWQYGSKLVGTSNRGSGRPMVGTPLSSTRYDRRKTVPKGAPRIAPRIIGGRRARPKRARTTRPARSGGFVTTRKFKSNPEHISGVNYTGEFGGTSTNLNMVVIGHTTSPTTVIYKHMWITILKRLFKLAEFDVLVTDTVMPIGGKLTLQYKFHVDAGLQTTNQTFTNNEKTLKEMADWFADSARPWNVNEAQRTNGLELYSLTFYPFYDVMTDEYSYSKMAHIRLDELVVKISSKSTFKMQNRSTHNSDGDDFHNADTIDQVPLYGKSYEGAGTGAVWINQENHTNHFVANGGDGVIRPFTPGQMKEPPKPVEFKGTQKLGKVRIDPGIIKTSSLYYTASHTPSVWTRMLAPCLWNSYTAPAMGRYRFFCLEKILDADEADPLTAAYEHNLAITSSSRVFRKNPTVQMFEAARNLVPN